jgi:hypothetical protein
MTAAVYAKREQLQHVTQLNPKKAGNYTFEVDPVETRFQLVLTQYMIWQRDINMNQ